MAANTMGELERTLHQGIEIAKREVADEEHRFGLIEALAAAISWLQIERGLPDGN